MNEEPATIDSLVSWLPPTEVLDSMRKSNPDAYDRIIRNGPSIVDMSVITSFEHETRKKMSFLNKKLALIELVRLKSWQKTLGGLNFVEDDKKLMYLVKHRNSLRMINNITSATRLNVLHDINNKVYRCKLGITEDLAHEYAENIETGCYSLSNNADEYKKLTSSIISSDVKLCKMISSFISEGAGPVEIVANIAELYLEFGKTQTEAAILRKLKLGDWDGIKGLPTELLSGIKKVANSMSEAISRKKAGNAMIQNNPELGIQEFKVVKGDDGSFTVKQIDKPFVVNEKKRDMNMFLKIIKMNYVPRVNDTFSTEIQRLIDKGTMISDIVEELHSRENPDQVHVRWSETGRRKAIMLRKTADYERLKSMTYEQLLDIHSNFYREPTFFDVVPMSFARDGVVVYPIKSRRGFLLEDTFLLMQRHTDIEIPMVRSRPD